jgi:EpsI family protein
MLTQNNQVRVLVLYWYQARGQTVAGETQNRLSQIRGAIFDRRTDGAIVRLATPVADLEKIDLAKSRLTAFASELYPLLRDVLPK